MRERTRTKSKHKQNARNPQSQLIRNASVMAVRGEARIQCPFLNHNESYIAFGGNLKTLRGRGYRLFGEFSPDAARMGGWLRRLGYPAACDLEEERIWKWIGIMLADLAQLSDSLGLVAGAINRHGRWRSLQELQMMAKERDSRPSLKACSLRIYAPADYLIRWRRWFSERLGFSYIPGGDWSGPQGDTCVETSPTAETIRAQLKAAGIKFKQVASRLGWTEPRVSRQLKGRTPLSAELVATAKAMIQGSPQCDLHAVRDNS